MALHGLVRRPLNECVERDQRSRMAMSATLIFKKRQCPWTTLGLQRCWKNRRNKKSFFFGLYFPSNLQIIFIFTTLKSVVLQTNCCVFSTLNDCRSHISPEWTSLSRNLFTAISHSKYHCIVLYIFFSHEKSCVFFLFIRIFCFDHEWIHGVYILAKIYAKARTIPTISLSTSVEYTIWKIDMWI